MKITALEPTEAPWTLNTQVWMSMYGPKRLPCITLILDNQTFDHVRDYVM